MARTIGKANIKKVKALVAEAEKKGIVQINLVCSYVHKALPEKVYDTWEMAYQEIERIIWDEVMAQIHKPYGT